MNQEVKKYTVNLAGQAYTIKSDESPVVLEKAAQLVDLQIKKLQENAPTLSLEKCALLVALDLARNLSQQEVEHQAITTRVEKMIIKLDSLV